MGQRLPTHRHHAPVSERHGEREALLAQGRKHFWHETDLRAVALEQPRLQLAEEDGVLAVRQNVRLRAEQI